MKKKKLINSPDRASGIIRLRNMKTTQHQTNLPHGLIFLDRSNPLQGKPLLKLVGPSDCIIVQRTNQYRAMAYTRSTLLPGKISSITNEFTRNTGTDNDPHSWTTYSRTKQLGNTDLSTDVIETVEKTRRFERDSGQSCKDTLSYTNLSL